LKKIVDDSISQAGSLVAFDRLRFDFNLPLTPEELQHVEEQVNSWIGKHSAQIELMPIAEAKLWVRSPCSVKSMVMSLIDFPGVSMELCGGSCEEHS